jgi:hypothetical protein
MKLTATGNSESACLQSIFDKGYKITFKVFDEELYKEIICEYRAIKNKNEFSAFSPMELLGLIHMWELQGNNWTSEDNVWSRIEYLE